MAMTMRLVRPRLTVGHLMLGVASCSIAMWLGITAYHVQYDPESRWIRHVWIRDGGPEDHPKPMTRACVAPFWPQYRRKLLGQAWPGNFACDCWQGMPKLFGIGVGTECRPYRLAGTLPVSRGEVWGIEASLRSLKTIGPVTISPSNSTNP